MTLRPREPTLSWNQFPQIRKPGEMSAMAIYNTNRAFLLLTGYRSRFVIRFFLRAGRIRSAERVEAHLVHSKSSRAFFQPDVRMTDALMKGGRYVDRFSESCPLTP